MSAVREIAVHVVAGLRIKGDALPAVDGIEAFSQYVSLAAIYRVTPLSEDVALAMVHHVRTTPYNWSDLPSVVLLDMSDNSIPF